MGRFLSRALFLLSLLAIMTCSSSDVSTSPTIDRRSRGSGQTRGGAVVLSRDERVAVACNRTASVVTVFRLDPTRAGRQVDPAQEGDRSRSGWEPWAAVIGADDDTAYVISRRKQVVFRISACTPTHRDDPLHDVTVGSSRPRSPSRRAARAFSSPTGARERSASSPRTTSRVRARIDLNEALVETGALGGVVPRTGAGSPARARHHRQRR